MAEITGGVLLMMERQTEVMCSISGAPSVLASSHVVLAAGYRVG